MQWNYDLKLLAELDAARAIRLRGAKAHGRHRMRFEISPMIHACSATETVRVLWLSGQVSYSSEVIGTLLPESSAYFQMATTAGARDLCLTIDLDPRQVERLDSARGPDGSLLLFLGLHGLADGPLGVRNFGGHDSFRVTTDQWVAFLQESGFGESFYIEVVAPQATSAQGAESCVTHLARARQHYLNPSAANAAATECRAALNACGYGEAGLPAGMKPSLQDGRSLRDLSKEERLMVVRWAVRQFTHLGPHPEKDQLTRRDARLAVHLTAALLAYEGSDRI